jgi:hypothetical protein
VIGVMVCVLPASLVTRFLPQTVQADDFSGTLWHGSAGRIKVNGRPAGALEWRLHPLALLYLHVAADLHWVKGGFVLDGSADVTRTQIGASSVEGSGPLADLADLGLGAGWRGSAGVHITNLTARLSDAGAALTSAIGDVTVSDVSSMQIASGANLGGYDLHFNDPASASGADMSASLADTGGPLQVSAVIHVSMSTRTGILSGTIKERPDAAPELHRQLENLAQLHAPAADGGLPVDLEFTF